MSIPLSQAIRLGAMLAPAAKVLRGRVDDGTCALGAALDAIGRLPMRVVFDVDIRASIKAACDDIRDEFPLTREKAAHPATGTHQQVSTIIVSLNDVHGWTREQIADWVESIERAQVAKDSGARLPADEPVAPAVDTLISVTR